MKVFKFKVKNVKVSPVGLSASIRFDLNIVAEDISEAVEKFNKKYKYPSKEDSSETYETELIETLDGEVIL